MSVTQRQNISYGLTQPLIPGAPAPIISRRAPTVSDFATPGTIWTNILTNQVYILASIVANSATWVSVAGGAGVFASLTVTPGPISLTGATTINTAGNATTSIGTGGTGLVNIGNATSGTNISGPLTSSGGAIALNDAGAFATNIASNPGTGVLNLGNDAGGTFIQGAVTMNNGNLSLTLGNLLIPVGDINLGGVSILSGAGSPNGAIMAAQGSLFLRTDGTGVNDRAYIAVDNAGGWTAIVTVA